MSIAINAGLLSFALSVAAAQVPVGVVRGSVHDELGDAMPGATITVSGGGREVKAVTDIEGRYRVEVHATGTFVVTVALDGFAPAKCSDLNIAAAGSEARCDVVLRGDSPVPTTDPRFQALLDAEARWRAHGPLSYEFTIQVRCFCVFGPDPFSYRVTNGQSQPLGETTENRLRAAKYYGTAEALFGLVRNAFSRGGFKVEVTYDPDTGFPMVADLDPRQYTMDDETRFTVSGFRKIDLGR